VPTQSWLKIENDSLKLVTLHVEPEGAAFPLHSGEIVSVFDAFTESPVTFTISQSDEGDMCISVWPGDGKTQVEKEGIHVLDLKRQTHR
jgi:hypothetical protein